MPITADNLEIHPKNLSSRQLQMLGLKGDGLTNAEIADKLGVTEGTVSVTLSQARKRAITSDPILRQRLRLEKRLKKTAEMIDTALDRGIADAKHNETGARVAIELNKGLGVLKDRVETSTRIETVETKRIEANLKLGLAQQFRLRQIGNQVQSADYEIVPESPKIDQPCNIDTKSASFDL